MTALGNHENDAPGTGAGVPGKSWGDTGTDSGGECGVPTRTRLPMPTPDRGQSRGWYAFARGSATFVIMNTEYEVTRGSEQYAFLDAAMAAVDRHRTPWLIFAGHRPMYSGNSFYRLEDNTPGVKDLEPLLFRHQVDVALWGHVHNAQLTCPMVNSSCREASCPGCYAGIVHAVVGNGGQGLTPFPHTRAAWSLYQAEEWGYNEMDIANSTHLTLRFFGDTTGALHKETTIVRKFPREGATEGGGVQLPSLGLYV